MKRVTAKEFTGQGVTGSHWRVGRGQAADRGQSLACRQGAGSRQRTVTGM